MSLLPTTPKGFSTPHSFLCVPAIASFAKQYPLRICSHSWMPLNTAIQAAPGFTMTVVYIQKIVSCEDTIQPVNQCAPNPLMMIPDSAVFHANRILIKEEGFPHTILCQLYDGLARPLTRSHPLNTRSKARALK